MHNPSPRPRPLEAGPATVTGSARAPSAPEPYCELEAQLFGPTGETVRQALTVSLQGEAEALQQRIQSKSLDRAQYALAHAYSDAVEAALGFLSTLPARR